MTIFEGITFPKIIHEASSKYNGKISVVQVGATRKLIVDRFVQSLNWKSPLCKKLVWGKVVEILKEEEPKLNNILILGLGGGTMPHLISKAFDGVQITSVEIDPVMVRIAREYFDLEAIQNHRVVTADALSVVVDPAEFDVLQGSFQALIVDIYIGEKYPDLGSSGNFVSAVKKMLIPGGLAIFNRIYIESHQDDVDDFVNQLEGFFKDLKSEVVAGYTNSDNILIYGKT